MKTKIKISKKSYDIDISEDKDGLIKVKIDDEEFIFSENEAGELIQCDREKIEAGKERIVNFCPVLIEKEIKSPIAGVISEIFVKEGDRINIGQKLLTIIAMKMENELVSENCGRIKKIRIKKDQFINAGDILIILE
jgi:biotin carboxyl carrier protein